MIDEHMDGIHIIVYDNTRSVHARKSKERYNHHFGLSNSHAEALC